jgi:hypothetical protein
MNNSIEIHFNYINFFLLKKSMKIFNIKIILKWPYNITKMYIKTYNDFPPIGLYIFILFI